MAEVKHQFWRKVRVGFRWLRILFLSLVLFFLLLLAGLNIWGMPRFVTSMIRSELQQQHFDIDIGKVRLSGFHHLVAENLRLTSAAWTNAPRVRVPRAEIILESGALRHLELKVRGLRVQKGQVDIPAASAQSPDRLLSITNIQTQLEFLGDDIWQLNDFQAEVRGAKARASAYLTNVSRFRISGRSEEKAQSTHWQRELIEILNTLEEFHFETQPVIALDVSGDAAKPASFWINLRAESHEVQTPWGSIDRFELVSGIRPQTNSVLGLFFVDVSGLKANELAIERLTSEGSTLWNSDMEQLLTNYWNITATNFTRSKMRTAFIDARLSSSQSAPTNQIVSKLTVRSAPFEIFSARTGSNLLTAELNHPLPFESPAMLLREIIANTNHVAVSTNPPKNLVSGKWSAQTRKFDTPKIIAEDLALSGEIETLQTNITRPPELGFWKYWTPYRVPWRLGMSNIYAQNINIGSLSSEGLWENPHFLISSLNAQLYGGSLIANSKLNVQSREVIGDVQANFDYHKGALLLEKQVQDWLAQFTWQQPPEVGTSFHFSFPPWDRKWDRVDKHLARTLELAGFLKGSGSFRAIPVDQVQSHFAFTNFIWTLPDLVATRPEGAAKVAYTGNVTNADFSSVIESTLDPAVLKPLLAGDQREALNFVSFEQPPLVLGTARGNWEHEDRIGFQGQIAATNFYVKGVPFADLRGGFSITNEIIEGRDIIAHRYEEEVRAPYLRIDIPGEVMFVTNVVSNIDPWLAMSLVGEDAYKAIDPFRFETTPALKINGDVPLRHWSKANLHFEVAGTNLSYWKFHFPNVVGDVYWRADHISFSNVFASFYGGQGRWSGHFYINDRHSADFSFEGHATEANLTLLMADLAPSTNRLEGTLNGRLVITSANSDDFKHWNGFGEASVKNGYLWSVPVFGVFTPVLDAFAPKASLSRITAADGTFNITNSVIETRDMQVKAPAFRLNYKGKVDFDGNLDAKVDAEILRDAWVVGRVFSVVLWPVAKAFEAKISGTLENPKTSLRYFPKFLFAPLKALGSAGESQGRKLPAEDAPSSDVPPQKTPQ